MDAAVLAAIRSLLDKARVSLTDFQVFSLSLGRGRYVEGFARAFNVTPDTFRALARAPVRP